MGGEEQGLEHAQQLLHPLDREQSAAYFREVISSCGAQVEVREQLGKGNGVFAVKDFAPDDLVFKEPPLVGSQHTANRGDALVCSNCFCFVGSIEKQIAHRLLSRDPKGGAGLNPDYVRSLWLGGARVPYSDRFPFPPLVHCQGGCVDCVYCSEACAAAGWAAHHSLLCSGPKPPASGTPSTEASPADSPSASTSRKSFDAFRRAKASLQPFGLASMSLDMREAPRNLHRADALRAFKKHADETNDIFHIAAQVIAMTILRADRLLTNGCAGGQDLGSAARNQAALQQAWQPFAAAWKGIWWECIAVPEDVMDEQSFRREIHDLASDSLQLLKAAIYDERFPALFHLDVFGSIISMFELNNLSLVVASPVEDYFLLCHVESEEGDSLTPAEQIMAQRITQPLLDALDKSYDAGCEGSAFYALQSCCNHSCSPNAAALKREGQDTDGSAVVLAKRAIAAGDEVCLSYIDESASYSERQAALRDYGFSCECEKCIEEATSRGKGQA